MFKRLTKNDTMHIFSALRRTICTYHDAGRSRATKVETILRKAKENEGKLSTISVNN